MAPLRPWLLASWPVAAVAACSATTGDVLTLAERNSPSGSDATEADAAFVDAPTDPGDGTADVADVADANADGELADAATPKCLGLFCLGSLVCCQNSASADYGKCAPPPPTGCK